MSQVVLITGCSSGIGRDLARRLSLAGYSVVATARAVETLADLPAALKLPLDVTQPQSIQEAVEATMRQFGRIDVLINNAGYSIFGAAEEVSDSELQGMFDVNVFGLMRMIRAVVPILRAQKSGRIINISSIVGRLVTPANGVYSSSKFSVEALSDALRLELEPFGIQVIVVEPAGINTHFADAAQAKGQKILSNSASPYQSLYRQFEVVNAGMRKGEPGPEVVSQVIRQAIEAPKPKARYLAGATFSLGLVIGLRDIVWGAVVRQMFKIAPPARQ